MDLTTTKSTESDTDTETPLQTHLSRALSLAAATTTDGSLHPLTPPNMMVVSYKECLKNHAATLGGLALDGCGEFMPSPSSTPLDPTSLKCAACGCHRNFHRRDSYTTPPHHNHQPPSLHWTSSLSPGQTCSGPSPSPNSPASPVPHQSVYPSAPHMLLALNSAHSGPFNENQSLVNPSVMNPHGRKRARTKFTEEQKVKMHSFAEKLGWKMMKGSNDDEKMMNEFCREVGVKRTVFKVWMHNNKHRRDKASINEDNVNGNEGKVIGFNHNMINSFGGGGFQIDRKVYVHGVSPDGSSSS